MSSKTPSSLVPKRRFPEFRDDPEWECAVLADIATFSSGGTPSKANPEYWDGHIPWISASSMYDTNICDSERKVTPLAIGNGTRIATAGSLLILTRGSMLYNRVPMGIASIDVTFNQDVRALTIDAAVDTSFLLWQLTAQEPRIPINDTGIGAGKIDTDDLRQLQIAIPAPREQQKIADCLGSLDDLIAAEGRKLEALRRHKQALMQQLFPQPGETVPRLRFPEFEDAGEWEATTIGALDPFVTSGSRGWAAYYADDGHLFIRITNLTRESINLDLRDQKFVNLPSNSSEMVRTSVRVRDVLISVTADIGIVGYIRENVPLPAYINQHIALVRFDHIGVCSEFIAAFLASNGSQRLFRASTDLGTKAGMNLDQVRRIPLLLPSDAEQQRIAECLSVLDTSISSQQTNLEILRTHKRGLLQQLFPSLEGA